MNFENININGVKLATKLVAKDTHDYFFFLKDFMNTT